MSGPGTPGPLVSWPKTPDTGSAASARRVRVPLGDEIPGGRSPGRSPSRYRRPRRLPAGAHDTEWTASTRRAPGTVVSLRQTPFFSMATKHPKVVVPAGRAVARRGARHRGEVSVAGHRVHAGYVHQRPGSRQVPAPGSGARGPVSAEPGRAGSPVMVTRRRPDRHHPYWVVCDHDATAHPGIDRVNGQHGRWAGWP